MNPHPRLSRILTLALVATCQFSELHAAPDRLVLSVDKGAAGDLTLEWQDACPRGGTDYAIHEGSLGVIDSHSALQCTTGGARTASVSPILSNSYYLVVPLDDGTEGSYGSSSTGAERSVGLGTCLPQQVPTACVDASFVAAGTARIARLDTVLAAAETIIEGGGSYSNVADMLALESDVADVTSNGVALYFTVDGIPTVIHDTDAARFGGPLNDVFPPSSGPVPPPNRAASATSGPLPASAVQSMLPRGQRMVGKDDDGDGRRDLPKHALILSPWAFQFLTNDSAPIVKSILEGVRDYQTGSGGSVVYRRNDQDLFSSSMSLNDYRQGWDEKDIVFLSSHGNAKPDAAWGPDPYVYLGIGGATCAEMAGKLLLDEPDIAELQGIFCGSNTYGPTGNKTTVRDAIGTRAFWEHAYGGNLDKKLIFMDACKTAALPGLAEALTGPDSIFLGWSDYVDYATSLASSPAVIRETAEDAFTVLRAFVRECAGGQCVDTTVGDVAEMLAFWDRADLRTREALTIPASPGYGFCGVSSTLPLSVTCPSCSGEPGTGLSTTFNFVLEGVEADEMAMILDPFDFAKYQLRLFADLNDVESGYALPLTDSNTIANGNGVWSDFLPVTLAMDNVCPYQIVEYNPWVLLPAFDESMPGNDGRDRIYSWEGPFTIEIDPVILP